MISLSAANSGDDKRRCHPVMEWNAMKKFHFKNNAFGAATTTKIVYERGEVERKKCELGME